MRNLLRTMALFIVLVHPSVAGSYDLAERVREYTLANGMKWLFVRRTGAPVFSGVIMARVGGADEVPGKTGLAHMFEHMAFKGSRLLGTKDYEQERRILDEIEDLGELREKLEAAKRLNLAEIKNVTQKIAKLEKEADRHRIKNEIWEILVGNGARDLNAYTAKDVTAYHVNMPANRLELWARIFAQMIFEPTYREFYTERNVVVDERRSLTDNNPDREMGERLLAAAFRDGPYSWSTIGDMKDISDLTIADAREFHKANYTPSNMVGVIVGDIDIGMAKRIIKEVFEKYPKEPVPPSPTSAGEPGGNIIKKIYLDAEPSIAIAYHKPTLPDPSEYVFDVIVEVLCGGRSGRLRKHLVYDKHMVQELYCSDGYPGSRLDNLFLIWLDPMKGYSLDEVLNAVTKEIEELKRMPVKDAELQRVEKQVMSGILFALDENEDLAMGLADFQTIFGDWRILADYPKNISKVSAEDVMRISDEYFRDDNRVVVKRFKSKR